MAKLRTRAAATGPKVLVCTYNTTTLQPLNEFPVNIVAVLAIHVRSTGQEMNSFVADPVLEHQQTELHSRRFSICLDENITGIAGAMDPGAVASIIAAPDFRIITTLKYVHFNRHDVANSLQAIQEWKQDELKLLCLHRQRLIAAAQACSWLQLCAHLEGDGAALGLQHAIEEATTLQQPEPGRGYSRDIRVRLLVDSSGHTAVETVPMSSEKPLEALEKDTLHELPPSFEPPPSSDDSGGPFATVYVDSIPTPATIFTAHKTTFRQPYDDARSRTGILHAAPMDAEVLLFNPQHEITEASVCTPYFFRSGGWVTPSSVSGGMFSVTKLSALQNGFCTERPVAVDELRDGEVIWLSNAVRGFLRGRLCKRA